MVGAAALLSAAALFLWVNEALAATVCCAMYALLALAALSIPRRVQMDAGGRIIIHCLLEMTIVEAQDIVRVERIHRLPSWTFPVAGVWGFGGYYGYWFDIRRRRIFKIYTADRRAPCLRICRREGCEIVVAAPWVENNNEV